MAHEGVLQQGDGVKWEVKQCLNSLSDRIERRLNGTRKGASVRIPACSNANGRD